MKQKTDKSGLKTDEREPSYMKKMLNTGIKYISAYIILLIVFIISLISVCLMPSKSMKENVSESADLLYNEGNRAFFNLSYTLLVLDNYTDALMINTAYSIDNTTPLYSALIARKNYIPGKTKKVYTDSVFELKSASKYDALNQVGELKDTVLDDIDESFEYARYWHGYLTYLRPLLTFMSFGNIRSLFILLFALLGFSLLYILYKKINIIVSFVFLNALLAIEYFFVGMTLHSASVFIITMAASIYILARFDKQKDFSMFFFIIGALTSFFDLSSAPLITLGIPLVIYYISLQNEKVLSFNETAITILKFCMNWGIAYIIILFSKWLIVDIIYNKDVIHSGMLQLVYRLTGSGNDVETSYVETLFRNFLFIRTYITFLAVQYFIILLFVRIKYKKINIYFNIKDLLPYIIIVFMCPVWYFLARQHSFQHAFFTYRLQIITIVAIQIIIVKIFGIYKQKINAGAE